MNSKLKPPPLFEYTWDLNKVAEQRLNAGVALYIPCHSENGPAPNWIKVDLNPELLDRVRTVSKTCTTLGLKGARFQVASPTFDPESCGEVHGWECDVVPRGMVFRCSGPGGVFGECSIVYFHVLFEALKSRSGGPYARSYRWHGTNLTIGLGDVDDFVTALSSALPEYAAAKRQTEMDSAIGTGVTKSIAKVVRRAMGRQV